MIHVFVIQKFIIAVGAFEELDQSSFNAPPIIIRLYFHHPSDLSKRAPMIVKLFKRKYDDGKLLANVNITSTVRI